MGSAGEAAKGRKVNNRNVSAAAPRDRGQVAQGVAVARRLAVTLAITFLAVLIGEAIFAGLCCGSPLLPALHPLAMLWNVLIVGAAAVLLWALTDRWVVALMATLLLYAGLVAGSVGKARYMDPSAPRLHLFPRTPAPGR